MQIIIIKTFYGEEFNPDNCNITEIEVPTDATRLEVQEVVRKYVVDYAPRCTGYNFKYKDCRTEEQKLIDKNQRQLWSDMKRKATTKYYEKLSFKEMSAKSYKEISAKWLNGLQCIYEVFMPYIETLFKEGMDWTNYGNVWTVNYVRPIEEFDLIEGEETLYYKYTNMEPVWKTKIKLEKKKFPHRPTVLTDAFKPFGFKLDNETLKQVNQELNLSIHTNDYDGYTLEFIHEGRNLEEIRKNTIIRAREPEVIIDYIKRVINNTL